MGWRKKNAEQRNKFGIKKILCPLSNQQNKKKEKGKSKKVTQNIWPNKHGHSCRKPSLQPKAMGNLNEHPAQ